MNRPGNIRHAGKSQYSSTTPDDMKAVEDLPEIKSVESETKFLAHDGHNYLARFANWHKPFVRKTLSSCLRWSQ
jgi:hypothetical protein